jgi:hypothetical protein
MTRAGVVRRHRLLIGGVAVARVLLAGLYRLSPLWPGPALPADATPLQLATAPGHLLPTLGCTTALLAPARVAVVGTELVLVPPSGGDPIKVVFPSGWRAWRLDGRAELVSPDDVVVGREGDILEGLGGGTGDDGAFEVCSVGQ